MAYNYGQSQSGYQPQGTNPPYYAQQQPYQPSWNTQQGMPTNYGSNPQYAEAGGMPKANLGFDDQTIRSAFVLKVFSLVAVMLSVVALMSAFPFLHEPTMQFVRNNVALYIIGYIVFFVVYIALICSESLRRSHPTNLICLGILTIAIGFLTMMITAYHSIASVFLCFIITSISCAAIALFATLTKKDLTSCIGFMFIATMCLALFGLILMFIGIFSINIRILYVVYSAIGALIFMVWLAIDIQMIMGGKTHEISPEEHILAAIILFLDIIQIFWFMLALFGDRD